MAFIESAVLRLVTGQAESALDRLNGKLRAFEAANAKMSGSGATAVDKQTAAFRRQSAALAQHGAAADKASAAQKKAAEQLATTQSRTELDRQRRIMAAARFEDRERAKTEKADIARQLGSAKAEEHRRNREVAAAEKADKAARRFIDRQIADEGRLEKAKIGRQLASAQLANRETALADRVAASQKRRDDNRAAGQARQDTNDYRYLGTKVAHVATGLPHSAAAAIVHGADIAQRRPGMVAGVVGAGAAAYVAKSALGVAGERDLVLKQLDALGYNKDIDLHGKKVNGTAAAKAEANALSKRYLNVSETDALEMVKEGTSLFGDQAHAIDGAKHLARMTSFLNSFMGEKEGGDVRREAFAAVKSSEIAGKITPAEMEKYMGSMAAMKIVYGQQANFQTYLAAQRAGGNALMGVNNDFRFGILPALVQEFGSGAGVQMATSFRHMIGAKEYKKKELAQMERYGLYDSANGKFKFAEDFKTNPFEAAMKTADVIAKKDFGKSIFGKDGEIDMGVLDKVKGIAPEVIGRMFGDRKAAQAQVEQIFQSPKLLKDLGLYRAVKADMDRIAKGDFFNSRTMHGAESAVKKQFENVISKLGEGLSSPAIGTMNTVARAMNAASDFTGAHPRESFGGIAAGGMLASMAAFKGIEKFTGAADMKVAAGAHTAAANRLTAAAGALTASAGRALAGGQMRSAALVPLGGINALSPSDRKIALAKAAYLGLGTATLGSAGYMAGLGGRAWAVTKAAGRWAMSWQLMLAMMADSFITPLLFGKSLQTMAWDKLFPAKPDKEAERAAAEAAAAAQPTADESRLATLIREIDALDKDRDAVRIAALTKEAEAINASIEKTRAREQAVAEAQARVAAVMRTVAVAETPEEIAARKAQAAANERAREDEALDLMNPAFVPRGDGNNRLREVGKPAPRVPTTDYGGRFQPLDPEEIAAANKKGLQSSADDLAAKMFRPKDGKPGSSTTDTLSYIWNELFGIKSASGAETAAFADGRGVAGEFSGPTGVDAQAAAAVASDAAPDLGSSITDALMAGGQSLSSDLLGALGDGAEAISSAGTALGDAITTGSAGGAAAILAALLEGGSGAAAAIAAAMASAININVGGGGAGSYEGRPANVGANTSGR